MHQSQRTVVPLAIVTPYVEGPPLALLILWLDNDPPHTAERLDQMFDQARSTPFRPNLAG